MGSVQFRGIEAVMDAYKKRKVEAWAIFYRKDLQFKGIGEEALEEMLEMLKKGSDCEYSLKVYEDIFDEKKIKSNVAHDGSFNFMLSEGYNGHDKYDWEPGRKVAYSQRLYDLELQNKALQERLDQMETEEEETEDQELSIGAIANNPKLLDPWFETIERMMGIVNHRQQPASIGSLPQPQTHKATVMNEQREPVMQPIPAASPAEQKQFTDDEFKRLGEALFKIYQKEDNIVAIMEKIAERMQTENIPLDKLVNISPAKLAAMKVFL